MTPLRLGLVLLLAVSVFGGCGKPALVLDRIREAAPGTPAEELNSIFGAEKPMYVIEAQSAPNWVTREIKADVTTGSYWIYMIGGPPWRLVIVHVQEDGKVGFVTWTYT